MILRALGAGEGLRLAVLSDLHYMAEGPMWRSNGSPNGGERRHGLVTAALTETMKHGHCDGLVILGDLLESEVTEEADALLSEIQREVKSVAPDMPTWVIPGNHDGSGRKVRARFGCAGGIHDITARNGSSYRLIIWVDRFDREDNCTRRSADMDGLAEYCATAGEQSIIMMQHNPLVGQMGEGYPYLLVSRREVMSEYSRGGVVLSLSGHYHNGYPLTKIGGVVYYTVPAAVQPPHKFAIVEIDKRHVAVEERSLGMSRDSP